jgi:hypothetical protein
MFTLAGKSDYDWDAPGFRPSRAGSDMLVVRTCRRPLCRALQSPAGAGGPLAQRTTSKHAGQRPGRDRSRRAKQQRSRRRPPRSRLVQGERTEFAGKDFYFLLNAA